MPSDKIGAAVEKAMGKKAKLKAVEKAPSDTKAKKLDKDVIDALNAAFPGAKLNKVRVHVGGDAQKIAKSLKARAFTMGDDIYFGKPGDAKNKEFLAEELTHVIQQGKGRMPKAQDGKALTSK